MDQRLRWRREAHHCAPRSPRSSRNDPHHERKELPHATTRTRCTHCCSTHRRLAEEPPEGVTTNNPWGGSLSERPTGSVSERPDQKELANARAFDRAAMFVQRTSI